MTLPRFFKWTVCGTLLALIYIHLQMQIFGLAYEGHLKEQHIKALVEKNGHTFYTISKLKSSKHLGEVLLARNTDMQFAGPTDIVPIAASGEFTPDHRRPELAQLKPERKPSLLSSLFSFGAQAEARTQE